LAADSWNLYWEEPELPAPLGCHRGCGGGWYLGLRKVKLENNFVKIKEKKHLCKEESNQVSPHKKRVF